MEMERETQTIRNYLENPDLREGERSVLEKKLEEWEEYYGNQTKLLKSKMEKAERDLDQMEKWRGSNLYKKLDRKLSKKFIK